MRSADRLSDALLKSGLIYSLSDRVTEFYTVTLSAWAVWASFLLTLVYATAAAKSRHLGDAMPKSMPTTKILGVSVWRPLEILVRVVARAMRSGC